MEGQILVDKWMRILQFADDWRIGFRQGSKSEIIRDGNYQWAEITLPSALQGAAAEREILVHLIHLILNPYGAGSNWREQIASPPNPLFRKRAEELAEMFLQEVTDVRDQDDCQEVEEVVRDEELESPYPVVGPKTTGTGINPSTLDG